jgi:hypothetical protein
LTPLLSWKIIASPVSNPKEEIIRETLIRKARFSSVKRAMDTLDASRYKVLNLVAKGEIEATLVDDHVVLIADSLAAYDAARKKAARAA